MLTRNAVLLAKRESTYGTDATPSASTDAILVKDLDVKPTGERLTRDFLKGSLSPLAHQVNQKMVDLSFTTEVKGAGSAYSASVVPEIHELFHGCAMSGAVTLTEGSEKWVYSPVSSGFDSLTFYVYKDGILYKVTGAMGTFEFVAEAGGHPTIKWTFKGLYSAPTDTALPSPTYDSPVPPIAESAALTIGGWADGVYGAFSFSLENAITVRKDLNSADGIHSVTVTGREPKGAFDPAADLEATRSFWANWADGTEEALSAVIGATQYNRFKIDAPKVQAAEITVGDRDGEVIYDHSLHFAQNTGDDELVLTFD